MWWISRDRTKLTNLNNFSSIAVLPYPMPDMSPAFFITGSDVPGELFVVDGPFTTMDEASDMLQDMLAAMSTNVIPDKFLGELSGE